MKEQRDFIQQLSESEKSKLNDITQNLVEGNDNLTDQQVSFMKQMFEDIPPLSEPIKVWRGIEANPEEFTDLPNIFVFTAFIKSWAYNFLNQKTGNLLLEITIPIGTKVLPWSEIMVFNNEECEVMLNTYTDKIVVISGPVVIDTEVGKLNMMICTVKPR
jgi:hypothetical protein